MCGSVRTVFCAVVHRRDGAVADGAHSYRAPTKGKVGLDPGFYGAASEREVPRAKRPFSYSPLWADLESPVSISRTDDPLSAYSM